MGLFKLTKDSKSGIPTAIEFSAEDKYGDSNTQITGDVMDDEVSHGMMGRGINSRHAPNSPGVAQQPQPMIDPLSIGFRGKELGMVGKGVNTRTRSGSMQLRDSDNSGTMNVGKKNPFESDDEEDQEHNQVDNDDCGGIDDIMQEYENKMKHLDQNKFTSFGDSEEEDDSVLSGIEEEQLNDRRKIPAKGKSIKKIFGIKGNAEKNDMPLQSFDYHKDFDNVDTGSYISGEYDAEFDNAEGMADMPIGVPNEQGGQFTHRQLEDELYLYKLETLNLTDACRELAEQLDEAERKLESVQAQATFRIHALEAELQDGHVGMKSLVKVTSTEMDGRLEALRALGKTASIQAEKIKERDMELNRMDGKLRKTLRDIKAFKRENKKIKDEKTYLKNRLGELEEVRDLLEGSLAKLTAEAHNSEREFSREDANKMEAIKDKLNDTLEQVGYLKSQLEHKDKELEQLKSVSAQKEADLQSVRDNLALKENDVVRVELQLERVRKDLFDAAAAAKTADEARLQAQSRETTAREELEEALGTLQEACNKVAMLESSKDELTRLLNESSSSAEDVATIKELKEKIRDLEKEINVLVQDKNDAVKAVEAAKESYDADIAKRQIKIETLVKDNKVYAEQMQSMLDEKESVVVDLRAQLNDTKSECSISQAKLEEELARKTREVTNVKVELEERTNDVSRLEEMLTKLRSEVTQQETSAKDERVQAVPSSSTNLAEMETEIVRMERELATSKRKIDAAQIELSEKDKAADRIRADLESLRLDKNTRLEELEKAIEGKTKSLTELRQELNESRKSNDFLQNQLNGVQLELADAKKAVTEAQDTNQSSTDEIAQSRAAAQAANHACEKLKTQVELLQKTKEELHSELVTLRIERNKEKESSTQAAAALAATNAARQAEMEMQIEKMQKEINTKKREIDTIKMQLHDKDAASAKLEDEVQNLRNEMIHYKEKLQLEDEQKAQALQAIVEIDYFQEDERSLTSMNSSSRVGLFSRFSRSKNSVNASDRSFENEGYDKDKDTRIEQLEKTVTENVLIISNLKKELVSASSKFNKDESQRRTLIQRLENENQAYSIKLEVLENEFNEMKKRREAADVNKSSNFDSGIDQMKNKSFGQKSFGQSFFTAASDHSHDSCSTTSGVSAISGASQMHPLERDNKKLKKQKALYEARISSLQTQLSEIQQIIPELMSKSKSQIAKLDHTIKTQKEEIIIKEQNLNDEISALKEQNEQLQAATRSRLQASDVERQIEIEDLRMRLEAKEATIAAMSAKTSKSFNKKKGGLLRKKKSADCNNSVPSGTGSSITTSVKL